ncbi:MAG TPA: hypothetical protein VN519_03195 [Bryobacteraceae bacterium]|nr:hypothetical protein [Bryobacteraceae bacterium]
MKSIAFLFCLLAAVSAHAQRGGNLLFSRYPFDAWAAENAKPGIRWNVQLETARLTPHQRLSASIRMDVDRSELKSRPGGQIVAFIRMEDASGGRYQTASTSWITPLREGENYGDLTVTFTAFVLPGDYVISLAVCDPKTLAHSFTSRRYRVAPIKSDPLPAAWKDLPAVEFVQQDSIPYSWYQPQLRSVIRLPVANEKPLRIELLVNITPSNLGSLSQFRGNMQVVIPSMKVLMGIDPAAGSVGLSIADINRQTLVYEQPDLRLSNIGRGSSYGRGEWSRLRPILNDFGAAQVDAQTLAGQHRMLGFISSTVSRLLAPAAPPRVLIVLSAPVNFTHQETAPPPALPPDPRRHVFYLRYAPFPPRQHGEWLDAMFADDIERILRPQGARIFRISSPEEFRKALAAILAEISA